MIIIDLVRGLGNQMFEYAFYSRLKSMGKDVAFRKSYSIEDVIKYGDNEVYEVFNTDCRFATQEEYERIKQKNGSIPFRIMNKLGISKNLFVDEKPYYGEYNEKFLNYENAYLTGYWQTDRYFECIKDDIFEAFTPKIDFNDKCKEMIKVINCDESSISVHVRLGDYLDANNQMVYGNICTPEYYKKAMSYMRYKVKNPTFYLFSNDLVGAERLFEGKDVRIMKCNTLIEGWADIYLMSQCRHNIIANSSFSWWGAYLNRNVHKIVVAPSRWVNTYKMPDICPEDWVRI